MKASSCDQQQQQLIGGTVFSSAAASLTDAEISSLVSKRAQLRCTKDYEAADVILKYLNEKEPNLKISHRQEGASTWERTEPDEELQYAWKEVTFGIPAKADVPSGDSLVVVTVDSPHYRSRLTKTLSRIDTSCAPIFLYDLSVQPTLSNRTVLYAGWRDILLPALLRQCLEGFVLIAEDDIRISPVVDIGYIRIICTVVFADKDAPDVVSFGHSWSHSSKGAQTLKGHLAKGGKLHATTLLAVRASSLDFVLDTMRNYKGGGATHLDQFLFHAKHKLKVLLSDPPLVGWAEVEETLTSAGSGQRREGGGRLGWMPEISDAAKIRWVMRSTTEN